MKTPFTPLLLGLLALSAIPNQAATLATRKTGGSTATITWDEPTSTLQAAASVTGVWTDVPGSFSPYSLAMTAQAAFFRLRTAQGTHSSNAVGYVSVFLSPGLNLIENPLDARASGGNTVSNVLAGLPDGTTVYKWNPASGFTINDYTTLFDWTDPQMSLAPGEGIELFLTGTVPVNRTFVGEVMQGNLTIALAQGYNLVGSMVPQAGTLTTDLGYAATNGDLVYTCLNPGGFTVVSWDDEWLPSEPRLALAEAIWIRKASGPGAWYRYFQITPP